jgi:hypothetical protein
MKGNNYFCELCGDYIEGYNFIGHFESNDGVKINNKYYCVDNCEKKIKNKLGNYNILNLNNVLKLIFFIIFLYLITICNYL